jgi:Fur family ferric uptake transcriptional regulator
VMRKLERMTKQRRVILEELKNVKSHPTAYDVYEIVRTKLPKVSLGTVYRNLEHLCASGLLQKLDMGQGQRRFDATTGEHMHIRCISCGKVDDVSLNTSLRIVTIMDMVSGQSGYEVLRCGMEFQGICPQCRKFTQSRQQVHH